MRKSKQNVVKGNGKNFVLLIMDVAQRLYIYAMY